MQNPINGELVYSNLGAHATFDRPNAGQAHVALLDRLLFAGGSSDMFVSTCK